jgi:hypothetical protein
LRNVIFDTNAYRRLSSGLSAESILSYASDIRAKEVVSDWRAFAHPTVMMELLAHLPGISDTHHDDCVRAITLLVAHCRTDLGKGGLAIIAPLEAHVCQALYDEAWHSFENDLQTLGAICEQVADTYRHTGELKAASESINEYARTFVSDQEQEFANRFKATISAIDPQGSSNKINFSNKDERQKYLRDLRSEAGLRGLALEFVYRAAGTMQRHIDQDNLSKHVDSIIEGFRVPLEIYREMWVKAAENQLDMDKPSQANSLWDMDVASVIGAGHVIGDGPVFLVTEEKMIVRLCAKAGCQEYVMKTYQYLASIHS